MGKAKLSSLIVFGLFFVMISGGIPQALAVSTLVTHVDALSCDTLVVPPTVEELGIAPPFPAGEVISTNDLGSTIFVPCPSTDNPGLANQVVDINNLSGFPFTEVWYVADSAETSLTNFDGVVSGPGGSGQAFRIDSTASVGGCGINCPLAIESMTADGIFEPGETWRFVIQDYSNTVGLPPSAINSIGVTSVPSLPLPGQSSGSIIAVQERMVAGSLIPIDMTLLILAGTQMTAAWMIPIIVAGIGIAIVIARKF